MPLLFFFLGPGNYKKKYSDTILLSQILFSLDPETTLEVEAGSTKVSLFCGKMLILQQQRLLISTAHDTNANDASVFH